MSWRLSILIQAVLNFFDFFDLIEENKDKSDIEIRWIYDQENESALEAGEDFKEDFESLNFNLISK